MYLDFICIFIVSLILIRLVKDHAAKLGLMDVPNERSAHSRTIPSGAGIGFYLAVALILGVFHFDLISAYLWTAVVGFDIAYKFKGTRFSCGSVDGFVEATNNFLNSNKS